MGIRIFNASESISGAPNGDVTSFGCQLAGDGSSVSFHLNLSKAPFDFKFTNMPSEVDATVVSSDVDGLSISSATVSQVSGDIVVAITLSDPLSSDATAIDAPVTSINVTLVYNA